MRPLRDLDHGVREAFRDPQVRVLLVMTGTLIACASLFYHWVEGWSLLDSAYFSVVTIATIGYGDFAPHTWVGKLFTIFYVLGGIGLFVTTATAIGAVIVSHADKPSDRS